MGNLVKGLRDIMGDFVSRLRVIMGNGLREYNG